MSFNEDGGVPSFLAVDNPNHAQGYMPFNEFSTMQLGVSKHVTSSSLFTGVMKQNDMQTRDLLKLFEIILLSLIQSRGIIKKEASAVFVG